MKTKRNYMKPAQKVIKLDSAENMLAASDAVTGRGMRYGGVDTDGSYDPD